jgi:hypothetical protein
MRRPLEPTPQIHLDGRPAVSETLVAIVGAHAVLVSTTLPDLPAQLHSSYLADPAADTQVSELRLVPRIGTESLTRAVRAAALPVAFDPRRALYDHLQRLQDMLSGALGVDVSIDLSDAACAAFEELAVGEHA